MASQSLEDATEKLAISKKSIASRFSPPAR